MSNNAPHPLDDRERPNRAYEWALETEQSARWHEFLEDETHNLTPAQLVGAKKYDLWLVKHR